MVHADTLWERPYVVDVSRAERQISRGVLLDCLESLGFGDGNMWLLGPSIMLGTRKRNIRITKAATRLSLGTSRGSSVL